jgi:hypothetical protein
MSEIVDKKRKPTGAKATVSVEKASINIEGLENFTPEEIARLTRVKQMIGEARYSEITGEHRKLLFVQWMIEHGKLKS